MKKNIILLFIFIYFFFSFSRELSFASQSENIWMRSVSHILKKVLDIDTNTLGNSIKQRNILIEEAVKSLPSILWTWNIKPTLDTTLLYKLELQKYNLSCEISALKTVLSRYGVDISEDEILSKIPKASYVYSGWIWWDPDREFVGYITWWQMKKTGYGVYPKPLFETIKNTFSWEIYDTWILPSWIENENDFLKKILEKLEWGSSIILWWDWCTERKYEDGVLEKNHKKIMRFFPLAWKNPCIRNQENRVMQWRTPEWKEVLWISWEHTFILLWYVGTKENPSHIIVWDTDTGRHIYPTHEWMRKWKLLGYRSLIIHWLLNPF